MNFNTPIPPRITSSAQFSTVQVNEILKVNPSGNINVFEQVAELIDSSTLSQGFSTSLSSDGLTLAVGAPNDNSGVGATLVYNNVAGTWTEVIKLIGTGNTGTSNQGSSVALSSDGLTLAVGGPHDNTNIGATWIFTLVSGTWTQTGSKLIGTGAIGTAKQGYSVSLNSNGTTLAIGALADNSNVGATWVFQLISGVWTQVIKLIGTGYVNLPTQGTSVSLSSDGTILAIGGAADNTNVGAVWIFQLISSVWTQVGSKLVGTGYTDESLQGQSVSLSSNALTLAVGGFYDNTGIGATWVFSFAGGVWTQVGDKLVGTGYVGSPQQGHSVSLSGDGLTLAAGGFNDDSGIGATWVFEFVNSVWTQTGNKLVGTGYIGSDILQGYNISLNGNGSVLAIGAPDNNSSVGAVWIYNEIVEQDSAVLITGNRVGFFGAPPVGQQLARDLPSIIALLQAYGLSS